MIGPGCKHEGNDVFSPRILIVKSTSTHISNPDEILKRLIYTRSYAHSTFLLQARPRWRSGHAVDCRSTTLRFKSGSWLSIAATAGVSHPDSFRTRKLRHLTWITVLRYASPRELILAAIVQRRNLIVIETTARTAGLSGHTYGLFFCYQNILG